MNHYTKVLDLDRVQLHTASLSITAAARSEMEEWVTTRPPIIQTLARRFDVFKVWRIKAGAPYGVTGPGTIGFIMGFSEDGTVIFVAHVLEFDDDGLMPHITPEKVLSVEGPIRVNIAPEWIEEDEPMVMA